MGENSGTFRIYYYIGIYYIMYTMILCSVSEMIYFENQSISSTLCSLPVWYIDLYNNKYHAMSNITYI